MADANKLAGMLCQVFDTLETPKPERFGVCYAVVERRFHKSSVAATTLLEGIDNR